MIVEEIRRELFRLKDEKYRDFQGALIPTVPRDRVIGVRTPDLRRMAKEFSRREGIKEFLADLPHGYFDEDQLHAFLLCEIRDLDECLTAVEAFLPFVDNWATCDQLSPKAFAKRPSALLPAIERWLSSDLTFTVRFGVGMLMRYFLDDRFEECFLEKVASLRTEEYYINMMVSWYFATALAKQYEQTVPYLERRKLSPFVHAKCIQKAVESYRISEEKKVYLKSLKEHK